MKHQLDIVTNLVVADRETNAQPTVAAADLPEVRKYLELLLLSRDTLDRHIAHLENLYRTQFVKFPLRADRQPHEPIVPPGQSPGFARHELLPEPQADAILTHGIEALSRDEFLLGEGRTAAELLLNPYALWDLHDLVAAILPDVWLDRMDDHAALLADELGVDLSIPVSVLLPEDLSPEEADKLEATMSCRKQFPGAPKQVEPNSWKIDLGPEQVQRLAERAYGTPSALFTLILHRTPVNDATSTAMLELLPAPTVNDITLPVTFRSGATCQFTVAVPSLTKRDPRKTLPSARSVASEPLPNDDFRWTTTDCNVTADWLSLVLRSAFGRRKMKTFA